jgi:hypothetical protein
MRDAFRIVVSFPCYGTVDYERVVSIKHQLLDTLSFPP